jgi:hypothetical protein
LGIALFKQEEDWTIECIAIEAAILEGKIDEPMYTEFPEGMDQLGYSKEEEMQPNCI